VTIRRTGDEIKEFVRSTEKLALTLTHPDGRRLEATVPAAALHVLAQVLGEMASGQPVTLLPQEAELSTHQAAALLGVSRPYLIKQLEAGRIPFRRVGSHRRIRYHDLRAYQEQEREARHRGLDELVALSEEMGLYAAEAAPSSGPGSATGR
jgi:excisionase family DNA binding protein